MINKYPYSTLFLEDFDIINMSKWEPDREIGVSINRIYIQIAKICHNSKKQQELYLLLSALSQLNYKEDLIEPKYVQMKVGIAKKCFEGYLKKLPKKTFIYIN